MGELTTNAPGDVARPSDALADLYRAESARAVNLAFLLAGQRQLAEDLAQEAFLRVASRLRHVGPDSFAAYLRQTVVNLVRSHYRHARVQRKYADHIATEAERLRTSTEASSAADSETRDQIWEALQRLPVHQREAIVCRFYLDMSEKQTAEALAVRIGTVKSATARGLRTLRAVLEPEQGL